MDKFEEYRNLPYLKDVGFDFDGTIAGNAKAPEYKLEEALDGALEAITRVRELGLNPVIWTARHWSDKPALHEWCKHYGIQMEVEAGKRLWFRSFDDRHIEFDGDWPKAIAKLEVAFRQDRRL